MVMGVSIPRWIGLNTLSVHSSGTTKVAWGIKMGDHGMENLDFSSEPDMSIDIIGDEAVSGMMASIEE